MLYRDKLKIQHNTKLININQIFVLLVSIKMIDYEVTKLTPPTTEPDPLHTLTPPAIQTLSLLQRWPLSKNRTIVFIAASILLIGMTLRLFTTSNLSNNLIL